MERIDKQMKGGLNILSSVVMSGAFGLAVNRFGQPGGNWPLPATFVGMLLVLQVWLLFTESKEEIELAEFKRIQSAKNLRACSRFR